MVTGLVLFLLGACTEPPAAQSPAAAQKLRILTYSSFVGEGSIGHWLKTEYAKVAPGVELELVEARNEAGLAGEIQAAGSAARYDMVLGLDALAMVRVGQERFLATKEISSSPMAILVRKDRASAALKARKYTFSTWHELLKSGLLGGKVLIQDPRFSSPGFSWLLQSQTVASSNAKAMHGLVRRTFPSWSASFNAIDQGEGEAIWTYASSLSYYDCEESKNPYEYLRITEGYVRAVETAGVLRGSEQAEAAQQLLTFLVGDAFQKKMVELNWVYPATGVKLPTCFRPRSDFAEISRMPQPSRAQINEWIDQWQLF